MAPSNQRKSGILSMDSFYWIGVHLTGPRFLMRKTCAALVSFRASNASSRSARLTTTVMAQKMVLLVMVKKKMVLTGVSLAIYRK